VLKQYVRNNEYYDASLYSVNPKVYVKQNQNAKLKGNKLIGFTR